MKKTIALALLFGLASTSAFASKKKAPNVYSATEEGPSEEVISSAPGYTGEPIDTTPARPAKKKKKVSLPPVIEAKAKAEPAPTPTPVPAPKHNSPTQVQYDAVPGHLTEPLVRRLRLVEVLITKYGRAYDYKSYTITELQTILGQLDAQAVQDTEARHRAETRADLKKSVEEIPAPTQQPAESTNSIGSEAPESAAPFEGGSNGAETVAPTQNP